MPASGRRGSWPALGRRWHRATRRTAIPPLYGCCAFFREQGQCIGSLFGGFGGLAEAGARITGKYDTGVGSGGDDLILLPARQGQIQRRMRYNPHRSRTSSHRATAFRPRFRRLFRGRCACSLWPADGRRRPVVDRILCRESLSLFVCGWCYWPCFLSGVRFHAWCLLTVCSACNSSARYSRS